MSTHKSPASERVYEELLSRVLSAGLQPDARITIDALARELGVSQTPVREALQRLAAEGIVVRHHLSGYRVAPKLTDEQFEDLVEVRLALEPISARRAAENMPQHDVDRLVELNEEMARALNRADSDLAYATFSRLDARFHDALALGGGNRYIRDSLLRLHTHAHLFRLANYRQITTRAVEEHAQVLESLSQRDPGATAFHMRHHIQLSAQRFRAGFAATTQHAA